MNDVHTLWVACGDMHRCQARIWEHGMAWGCLWGAFLLLLLLLRCGQPPGTCPWCRPMVLPPSSQLFALLLSNAPDGCCC
jgi:hypothetical protein